VSSVDPPVAGVAAPEVRSATDRKAEPPDHTKLGLPSFATLMRWLFIGRTVLAVMTLIQASLSWSDASDAGRADVLGLDIAYFSLIVVVLALAVTAYGAYTVFIQKRRPGLGFFQSQAAMDLLLVTALVHFAGAHQSGWAALYVLVMAVYALLMPLRSGLVMAAFGSALFLADATFTQPERVTPGLWGQVAVFTFVFIVVAFLGQRLRAAAFEQSVLESELEQVRLEADEILRNIRSGVMTVDGQGNLAFINPTAESILGFHAGPLLGKPILEDLEQRAPELHSAIVTGIRRGRRVPRAEGVVHREGGRCFPIGLSTTTFERESESIPSVTAIFTDISDLQYLQELHRRAERLEAVASLSASLAHEIRNPLASIRSAVEQLARSQRDDPDERLLSQLIVRESDRLSRLLGEFLDFSRVRATDFRAVNLLSIVTDAVRMVKKHPDGNGIQIKVEGGPTLLHGDEDLIHRIAWNLLLNAAQALRGQGKITVSIDQPAATDLPRGSEMDPAVRLRVADDGPGIDPELRERVFEPFVSGRPGGTGLGLAIVLRAVDAHRGLVLLDSAPGQGTTFTILLHAKMPTEDGA
jgi:two-component system sensor histidine kinase PilS (NtrC family)